jgi:hypothetical protein
MTAFGKERVDVSHGWLGAPGLVEYVYSHV